MRIDPEHLRAYAARPWAELERSKREHIAARYREDPAEHAASVARMTEHLKAVRPDWPTEDDLARDLADHVELKRKLDLVAAVYAGRRARGQ